MKRLFLFIMISFISKIEAQEPYINTVRDAYLNIATDARASGQGDIGVATSADAFSQFWNPAKYVFSDTKSRIAIIQMLNGGDATINVRQLNFTFYNTIENRSAYAISIRNYAYEIGSFDEFNPVQVTHEVAIEASYTLRLSQEFAMSVAGRFISLKGKQPLIDGFSGQSASNMYGIDVSGFYNGNDIAYNKFNGRWRAGFSITNLRGESEIDNADIEIYAPSMLKVGLGFDFIFDHNKQLAVTTEYKRLLEEYVENRTRQRLAYGLEGEVAAIGFEFIYREKILARTGYSHGIDRLTDTFVSLGAGFRGRYADVDLAFLVGLSERENPLRQNLRLSLSLDLAEVLSIDTDKLLKTKN